MIGAAQSFPSITIHVLLAILAITPGHAQEPDPSVLDNAAGEIKANNQYVTAPLLAGDQAAIRFAYPTIQKNLSYKGFTQSDINQAVVAGWKTLRAPTAPLRRFNGQTFAAYVTKLGRLRIESSPIGANIDIDDNRQDSKTNTAKWLVPKRYTFLLSKDGYIPVQTERTVFEGDNPPLVITLKPTSK